MNEIIIIAADDMTPHIARIPKPSCGQCKMVMPFIPVVSSQCGLIVNMSMALHIYIYIYIISMVHSTYHHKLKELIWVFEIGPVQTK